MWSFLCHMICSIIDDKTRKEAWFERLKQLLREPNICLRIVSALCPAEEEVNERRNEKRRAWNGVSDPLPISTFTSKDREYSTGMRYTQQQLFHGMNLYTDVHAPGARIHALAILCRNGMTSQCPRLQVAKRSWTCNVYIPPLLDQCGIHYDRIRKTRCGS